MIVSLVFTLGFHRGLPSVVVVVDARGRRLLVGVAEPCLDADNGDGIPPGVPMLDGRFVRPLRGSWLEPVGMLTFLLPPG